ncbi:MAG: HlyD family secretion protein [Verrucomicrobiia bacterium]
MKKLPKIPSPPTHYWDFFRQHILPVIVFLLALYAAVILWRQHIAPANIIGEVEMTRANVTTTIDGTIADFNVDLLQRIQKGQPICTIVAYDSEATKASLAAIAADLETLRTRTIIDQRRNNNAYEQYRIELLLTKVELANERVNLDYAKSEYDRTYKLFKEGSDTEYQVNYWRSQRDMYQAKVTELEKVVTDLEQTVERLKPLLTSDEMEKSINKVISDGITAKQMEIEALQKPVVLKAPMDGFVSAIFHRVGEKVPAGSPIITISATNATRIIAFVRQPLNIKPAIGDSVEIRSRTHDRTVGYGTVIDVGAQLEPISASLLPYITGSVVIGRGPDGQNITEYGLPFLVTLPDNMQLLPGEVVVMNIVKRR